MCSRDARDVESVGPLDRGADIKHWGRKQPFQLLHPGKYVDALVPATTHVQPSSFYNSKFRRLTEPCTAETATALRH